MNWLMLIGIFGRPLGALVNKGIAAASAAAITWAVAKGIPNETAVTVVGSIALALSTVISGFASSQGVQIPLINKDENNGVKVVPADGPGKAVDAPLPKA